MEPKINGDGVRASWVLILF